jgi:hypothetical protein
MNPGQKNSKQRISEKFLPQLSIYCRKKYYHLHKLKGKDIHFKAAAEARVIYSAVDGEFGAMNVGIVI